MGKYKGLGYDFRKIMNLKEIKKAQKELDTEVIECPACKKLTNWLTLRDYGKCLDCVKAYNTNEFSSFYKPNNKKNGRLV